MRRALETRNQLSGSYRTKGSNPLPSATEKACNQADCRLFFYVFFYKQVVRAYRCFYKGLVGEVWAEAEAKNEAIEIEFSVYNVKAFT